MGAPAYHREKGVLPRKLCGGVSGEPQGGQGRGKVWLNNQAQQSSCPQELSTHQPSVTGVNIFHLLNHSFTFLLILSSVQSFSQQNPHLWFKMANRPQAFIFSPS